MTRWCRLAALGPCLLAAAVGANEPQPAAALPEREPLVLPAGEAVRQAKRAVRTAIASALSRTAGDQACAEMLRMFDHALEQGQPTVEQCEAILSGLTDGRGFLALPEFVALREKLFVYAAMLRTTTETDIESKYQDHLAALHRAWDSYQASHDAESLAEIHEHYRWLAQRGLAPLHRRQVATALSRSNLVLRLASSTGNRLLPSPYTQSFRQSTSMEGTPATVSGTIVAVSHLYTPQNGYSNRAGINVNATVNSQVGLSRQRISASAEGRTNIYAQVLLEVHNNEFRVAGTTLTSRTSMNLTDVSTRRGCGLADRVLGRVGQRVFDKRRGEINAQADQQITAQGKAGMVAQVQSLVGQINSGKQEVFAPMVAFGISPDVGIGSDPHGLNMTFRVATPEQFAAPEPPPGPSHAGASYLAAHESAANNCGQMFSGLAVDEQRFREAVFDSLGFTPVETVPPPGGEVPHTITFSRGQPLQTKFEDDRVKVHVAMDGLTYGTERFSFEKPVTVDVIYRFDSDAQGVLLLREAMECHVEPPQKAKFEETLSRFFAPMARQDELTTLGQLLTIVRLRPGQPTCSEGWLQMPLVER